MAGFLDNFQDMTQEIMLLALTATEQEILGISPVSPTVGHIILAGMIIAGILLITVPFWLYYRQSKDYRMKQGEQMPRVMFYSFLFLFVAGVLQIVGSLVSKTDLLTLNDVIIAFIFFLVFVVLEIKNGWRFPTNEKRKNLIIVALFGFLTLIYIFVFWLR